MRSDPNTIKLRERLAHAIRREKLKEALEIYDKLEQAEQSEARWPHRKGDLLRRMDRKGDAIIAYERAIKIYADNGFVARAAAMAKVIIEIDPRRSDVLDQINTSEAKKLHRTTRDAFVTADEGPDITTAPDTGSRRYRLVTGALLLQPDPHAAEGEVKFQEPNTGEATTEIDVSGLEVARREELSVGEKDPALSEEMQMPRAEELAQLPSMTLFAEVPQAVLSRIISESMLVELGEGEKLIAAGTPANSLYPIISGQVEIHDPRAPTPLLLGEGDIIGESCLLKEVRYPSDVIVRGSLQAICIAKGLLDQLVREFPAVGDILIEILGRRLIANLMHSAPMFENIDDEARAVLAKSFEIRRASAGTHILIEGKKADGLYIPLLGELVLIRDGNKLGNVGPGEELGQHALLDDMPSEQTVRAETEVLLLRMPKTRLHQALSEHPSLSSKLRNSPQSD